MQKDSLIKIIYENVKAKKSTALIAPSGAGKSWFALHDLVPFLKKNGLECLYIKESITDDISTGDYDYIVADEFETLLDKEYLQTEYPEDDPYYTETYLDRVMLSHDKFTKIDKPIIFIITRNADKDIVYLQNNLKIIDSGQEVQPIYFIRDI